MPAQRTIDILVPKMGESDAEATIDQWFVKTGDEVLADAILCEISTQKVQVEITAPEAGVVAELLHAEGDVVPVEEVLARLAPPGTKIEAGESSGASAADEDAPPAKPAANGKHRPPEQPVAPAGPGAVERERQRLMRQKSTPLVRNIAQELGIDIAQVPGTGTHGRVTKKDVVDFLEQQRRIGSAQSQHSPVHKEPVGDSEGINPGGSNQLPALPPRPHKSLPPGSEKPEVSGRRIVFGDADEYSEPMNFMRRAIAEHMSESQRRAPHAYTVHEIDMTPVMTLRRQVREEFEARYGVKLTPLAFILKALTEALGQFPILNARVDGDNIVYHRHINIGVAVAIEDGLIVPVVRQMEEKSLIGIARSLSDLARRARGKRLTPHDVEGGTFTVTSPGQKGAIMGTPILNQPQVGIVHVGAIRKVPAVLTAPDGTDSLAIRSRVIFTLGLDHRAIDGWVADSFLEEVRVRLERCEFQVLE
ncbi:MAG: dihydrolipoamide acetyltransferase family protein [Sumerlaeia bacterium]